MEKKRILVVEDEYSINDVLTFALRKEGYEVRSAFNGKVALELMESFKPDLVLLDLMLPDMDGFDICREISKDVYVIMITARGEFIDKILGLELGADDYIIKPFEIKEVLVRVRVIFRRSTKCGTIDISREKDNKCLMVLKDQRRVLKEGEEVLLARKEFELLNFLWENKGIIFSRDELLDKVWGYDFEGESRTVDVHIRRLRNKLNEDKDNSTIETVFGVGYVMR